MSCAQDCVMTFTEIDVPNENIYKCCKIETKANCRTFTIDTVDATYLNR